MSGRAKSSAMMRDGSAGTVIAEWVPATTVVMNGLRLGHVVGAAKTKLDPITATSTTMQISGTR